MDQLISEITAVSSKGQIVLPKKIRDQLRITTGTKLMVISDNENIILKPIQTPDISEFNALKEAASIFTKETDTTEEDNNKLNHAAPKQRKLGIAKGKIKCPLTLEEFDRDNEEIANMFLNGDL